MPVLIAGSARVAALVVTFSLTALTVGAVDRWPYRQSVGTVRIRSGRTRSAPASEPEPAEDADGREAADVIGRDHRPRADVRLRAVPGEGARPRALRLCHEGILRVGHRDGKPYTTRVVVRIPRDARKFSGLVLAESMHVSGAAHAFEFTAAYVMDSGHAAVEILTTSQDQFVAMNAKRYEKLHIEDGQQDEILAQVGALVKAKAHSRRRGGPQDGDVGQLDELRHADQLPAGTPGLPYSGHAADLRRLHADFGGPDDHGHRRAADPAADDARGRDERAPPPRQRRARQAIPAVRDRGRRPRRLARQRAPAPESVREAAQHVPGPGLHVARPVSPAALGGSRSRRRTRIACCSTATRRTTGR